MSENFDAPRPAPPREPLPSNGDIVFLSSKRVTLRALADRDRRFLYELMISPGSGGRVRFGGGTPSPEKVLASLWESVLAQFIIEGTASRTPFGLVAITSANFRDGFAYLSALGHSDAIGSGLVAEGVMLAFHYAFLTWPFRKIYMESTEDSYEHFRSGLDTLFVEEGRLRSHTFSNGRYLDLLVLALYRETWQKVVPWFSDKLHLTNLRDTPSPALDGQQNCPGPTPVKSRSTFPS